MRLHLEERALSRPLPVHAGGGGAARDRRGAYNSGEAGAGRA